MNQRLREEHEAFRETLARSDRAWPIHVSADGRVYAVEFEARTLMKDASGRIREEERVIGVVYQLGERHPLEPPIAVVRETDVFNTHVSDPRRGPPFPPIPVLCLGDFPPQLRLADWVIATWDVLRWQKINLNSLMNPEAAAWAVWSLRDPDRFPVDRRSFWSDEEGG